MDKLQDSAVHEAGHVVVADFFDLEVSHASLLPVSGHGGMQLAQVGFTERLEGVCGAAVLAAGEQAVKLAGEDPYPVPAMPAAKPWHRRAISVGCQWRGDGYAGDRRGLAELVDDREAAMARRTARGILARRWGASYVIADGLLREGLLTREQIDGLLHPERGSRARVFYDASATRRGVFWGGGGRPSYADEWKPPEQGLRRRRRN